MTRSRRRNGIWLIKTSLTWCLIKTMKTAWWIQSQASKSCLKLKSQTRLSSALIRTRICRVKPKAKSWTILTILLMDCSFQKEKGRLEFTKMRARAKNSKALTIECMQILMTQGLIRFSRFQTTLTLKLLNWTSRSKTRLANLPSVLTRKAMTLDLAITIHNSITQRSQLQRASGAATNKKDRIWQRESKVLVQRRTISIMLQSEWNWSKA